MGTQLEMTARKRIKKASVAPHTQSHLLCRMVESQCGAVMYSLGFGLILHPERAYQACMIRYYRC